MGIRDAWNGFRQATGRNDTGGQRWINRGAGQVGGRIGGALGAAAGPPGVLLGTLGGSLLGSMLAHRWGTRGANQVPGSPSPDYTGHDLSTSLGIPDYAHDDPYGGQQGMGPPAMPPEFAGAQADSSGSNNPFHGAQSSGSATGPFTGATAQGQGSRVGGGQNLGTGQAPGFGWSSAQGPVAAGDAIDSGNFFGNFGPSMAEQLIASWTRNKVR